LFPEKDAAGFIKLKARSRFFRIVFWGWGGYRIPKGCATFAPMFWNRVASFALRQRLWILLVLAVVTGFMASRIPDIRMQYVFGGLLPQNDPTHLAYERFQERFGSEGSVMLIGVETALLRTPEGLQAWHDLAWDIDQIQTRVDTTEDGRDNPVVLPLIDSLFSITRAHRLERDTVRERFALVPVLTPGRMVRGGQVDQAFVDSLHQAIADLPFYDGLLVSEDGEATLLMVFIDPTLFNSERRGTVVEEVTALADRWSEEHDIPIHLSGLPFIRVEMTNKVKGEIGWFISAALLVTALLLWLFFRNVMVMAVSLLVVFVGVIWSLGTMALFDFPLTLLMSLIPPLMIVIGVPNCIYLVNKYHAEYKRHGNKAMALQRMVVKVGNATLLTNVTTSFGFATFIFTHSDVLRNFGVVASLNVVAVFLISLAVIPALFSLLPPPQAKHTRHLDRQWMLGVVSRLVSGVQHHRPKIYLGSALVFVLSVAGILQMKTTGNIVDDLPTEDRVIQDLRWIEGHFHGVMPFEILVDTRKEKGATSPAFLAKVEDFQSLLREYPEFSRSVSAADAAKFGVQAFYGGDPERYRLPSRNERSFLAPYFRSSAESADSAQGAAQVTSGFFDSTRQVTRITVQMADIGTLEMRRLLDDLRPRADSIFSPEEYEVTYTGTSVVFLKGTSYMVGNLGISILLAVVIIAVIMSLLFHSARMVFIALIPNVFPLIFTAGIMGWLGIPIKPSTILVFSIALGISVDDTIHFLAKYRQELNVKSWNIGQSVIRALKETGVSMMYTSIVLFFGFLMFAMSEFEGTRALGLLISITLGMAMFTNLLLLPSLLLSFERALTTRSFREPLFDILDEEEDIELEGLEVRPGLAPGKGDEQHEDLIRRRGEG
jgi:predicted RND superfamily exporter protein